MQTLDNLRLARLDMETIERKYDGPSPESLVIRHKVNDALRALRDAERRVRIVIELQEEIERVKNG